MAKDPAFLFYPGDYLRDTQCMSANAQVAYDRIMCEHMRNICISQSQLKFFTKRLTDDEREELLAILVNKDDGYQIEWVANAIAERRAYSASRKKNRQGKSSKSSSHISSTYVKHMEDENEIEIESKDVVVNANTNTQLAIMNKRESKPSSNESALALFTELGRPDQAQEFMDYYDSNGWKVGRNPMKDWKATARRWVRNAKPMSGEDRKLLKGTTVQQHNEGLERFKAIMEAKQNGTSQPS